MRSDEAGAARQEANHAELIDLTTNEHGDRELSNSTSDYPKYLAKVLYTRHDAL